MDFVTPKPEGAAARLRIVSSEMGIGPHDPMAPLIEALADVTAAITAARPGLDDAAVRDIGNMMIAHTNRNFLRATNWRTAVVGAVAVGALLVVVGVGGYWLGWRSEVVLTNDLGVLLRTNSASAQAALVLLRNNDLGNVMATCQPLPQPSGRKACALAAFTGPPVSEAPQK